MNGKVRIACVTVGDPPDSVVTLEDWYVWRAQEDLRMDAEMTRQREEYFAGLAEMVARDADNETQH